MKYEYNGIFIQCNFFNFFSASLLGSSHVIEMEIEIYDVRSKVDYENQ